MRIIYLHQYFNTREMSGGTRSFEFARRLVDMGHSVEMLTSDRSAEPGAADWRVTEEAGIRVHWTPVTYSNNMSYPDRIRAFAAFALRAARRASGLAADVVFASSTPLTIALPGSHAARRLGVPLVLEVRDLWPEVPIALGALKNPLTRGSARWLEAYAYRNSERIVALSPGMRDGVVRRGYPADRVQVIPNASDLDLFADSQARGLALRSNDPWIGDRPLVVYCGTVGMVNGVEYLVRVAAIMKESDPDVRFLIAGSGRCLADVEQEARASGVLGTNLKVIAEVAKRDVPGVIGAATIATSTVIDVPELQANSANKFFDALAAGVPIAINHEGWQADLLRVSGAGLVLQPGDPAAAAASIREVVRNPSRRDEMARAARHLAEERFNRDTLARELESVLAAACDDYRSRRQHRGRG
jgi:glycosyltransferase involved in cell wall biosynthesis